jgi:AcrR family transcriptional regulator
MATRSGRRRGDSGTRDAIRAAAIRQFAERGYDRTSLRSIAADAGVDPALVGYFFTSKQRLFVEVTELPVAPERVVAAVFDGDRDGLGLRLATFLVNAFEQPEARRRLIGLVRAAASEPEAARIFRERIATQIFARIVNALDVPDADVRASLLASQIAGLIMARYVIALEPLASLPPQRIVTAIAPNLQRYLTEPLDGGM